MAFAPGELTTAESFYWLPTTASVPGGGSPPSYSAAQFVNFQPATWGTYVTLSLSINK